jgi:hypothetical protein
MNFELKCPSCGASGECVRARPVDALLKCCQCKLEFEYRQFRECACAFHRGELERECPELSQLYGVRLVEHAIDLFDLPVGEVRKKVS